MRVIREFDPWKSELCTCPKKYSFNPYTGCAHRCLYCYATYIPRFYHLREKRNLFRNLERDLKVLPEKALISMSNSSDPYPPVEREKEVTRNCLKILKDYDVRLLIVTKSDIVVRDVDILSEMRCAVSITITGLDFLEPNAPPTERRVKAMKELKECGIPTILRFDPIIPHLNRLSIIEDCMPDHVVTSTLKLKPDSLARVSSVVPEIKCIYKHGEKIGGYIYLPKEKRFKMLKRIEECCKNLGISCAFCREGFEFDADSCDGSHLIT